MTGLPHRARARDARRRTGHRRRPGGPPDRRAVPALGGPARHQGAVRRYGQRHVPARRRPRGAAAARPGRRPAGSPRSSAGCRVWCRTCRSPLRCRSAGASRARASRRPGRCCAGWTAPTRTTSRPPAWRARRVAGRVRTGAAWRRRDGRPAVVPGWPGPWPRRGRARRDPGPRRGRHRDGDAATAAWEAVLRLPPREGDPVWLHGDLLPGNLLGGTAPSRP
ncbi:phosphotransferase [Streptomyces thermolilacinus]|uniref:phosphotransferase n=1 Tax=Streptomyces thermolilacinus TaxID=285540 RepID=UPI000D1BB596|nr:phosphotransferase [Streptomyces thermolilacinus]